jgi:hypothetical protein
MWQRCVAVISGLAIAWAAFAQGAGDDKATLDAAAAAAPKAASTKRALLTESQRAEIQARMEAANAVLGRLEHDPSTKGLSSGWRSDAINVLMPMSSADIKALATNSGWSSLQQLRGAAKSLREMPQRAQPKLLGDLSGDLVFYPITPCRNADTRFGGGPITGGTARTFNADLGGSQGGSAGCYVVPAVDAAAWAMNITVINMNNLGFVAVRSVGSSNTTATANYTGPGQQVNNFVIVANNYTGGGAEWEVFAATTVDVVIDLYGYFLPPFKTALDCTTVFTQADFLAGQSGGVTSPTCPAGYTQTGGACYWQGTGSILTDVGPLVSMFSGYFCYGTNTEASTRFLRATAYCCRTPGR